ncbi:MAG: anti-sigma regulatory factor [Verrucomicrobiota bacterium]
MPVVKEHLVELRHDQDVVLARQAVRKWAEESRFSLVDQTKLVTAASELARNTVLHAGGGRMRMELLSQGVRTGLKLIFEDEGPGIANIELAMRDGYTTAGGLGLGLGGAKRLVNEFELQSKPGLGTRIAVTRWR